MIFLLFACTPTRDCGTELFWAEAATSVSVVGDWNGWNAEAEPLRLDDDGVWRIDLQLPAGDYAYQFVVDGVEARDPFAPLIDWDPVTDEERSLLRVEDCSQPTIRVDSTTEAAFVRGDAGLASVVVTLDGVLATVDVDLAGGIHLPDVTAPGKHTWSIEATDDAGQTATARIPFWVEDTPFTWDDAVIYQVITDRFAGDDGPLPPAGITDRFGGTFNGVRAAVEDGRFEELGVNTLWLSPVQTNAPGEWPGTDGHDYTGYHGYWPISPTEIEPAFGDGLDTLVAAAHARGMRVIVDIVPNHVHEDHPYAQHDGWTRDDDCVCGSDVCPWSTDIETCWFTDYLPDLVWENPEVASTVVADTIELIAAHDFDGVRVDAVPMIRRHAVRELVWGLSRAFEQGGADFYTVGETYTGIDGQAEIKKNLGPYGLDGQFDFPVLWALRDYVINGTGAGGFAETLAASEAAWDGSGSVMAPLLGNHDTTRFVTEAAGDGDHDPWTDPAPQPTDEKPYRQLLLAQAIVLTLPGAPVIYQGDEIGLAGTDDPDNRRPMPAELNTSQAELRDAVGTIGRARACFPALRRGTRETLIAKDQVYAQRRELDGEAAILVVNASDSTATMALDLDGYTDLLSGSSSPTLGAWDVRLYLPSTSACLGDAR